LDCLLHPTLLNWGLSSVEQRSLCFQSLRPTSPWPEDYAVVRRPIGRNFVDIQS